MEVQSKKGQKMKSPRGGATIKESSLFLGSLVFELEGVQSKAGYH